MERVLAILDEEEEYVSRLLRYLNGREEREFELAAFTSEESFRQYREKHEVGLLVCEETLYAAMEHTPDCPTVLLSPGGRVREGTGPPVICKYQSAQDIFCEIIGYYRELTPQKARAACVKNARIVTVCSAFGGSGVSALAYTLAKRKAKGERAAFISLDPFYQPERSEPESGEALTEAIYFIRQNSAKFSEKLKLKTAEHVDCLYGVAHWADLSECTAEDMAELLRQLASKGDYAFVAVDAGAFTAASAGCMEMSDTVVLISQEGKKASERERLLVRQAKRRDAGFEERLLRVARQTPEKMAEEVLRGLD